jgi:hypothetical protein
MSATGFILFAAAQIRRASPVSGSRPEDLKWRFLPSGLYLVVALLLAAAVIALASRWRRAPRSYTASASEQLSEFRLLYEKGQMSRDEFERVKARLGGEIRGGEPAASPRPTPTKPEQPAETPATQAAPPAAAPGTPQDVATPAGPTTPESVAPTVPPPAQPAGDGQTNQQEPPESARPV